MKNLIIILLTLIIMCGCKNSSNSKNNKEENYIDSIMFHNEMDNTIDILVPVNLNHTEDEDMKQMKISEYEKVIESDRFIKIETNSTYYKQYTSGKRFFVEKKVYDGEGENIECLTLGLDLVNNTKTQLDISELEVIVENSKPDSIPLIYICTPDERSNTIAFTNESWFDWGGVTFSYSILKEGEHFDGNYKENVHFPYFDKIRYFNLLPSMKDMGYDFDGLINSIKQYNIEKSETEEVEIEPWQDNYLFFYIDENDSNLDFFKKKFYPFSFEKSDNGDYEGYAFLYGSLIFDKTKYKVDFIAKVSLSTAAGWGALSFEADHYNVKLRTLGNSYKLRYPYTTVIDPYGSEYIKLSISADKSSSHKFYINIKNNNNLNIRTKDIIYHHYFPKNEVTRK